MQKKKIVVKKDNKTTKSKIKKEQKNVKRKYLIIGSLVGVVVLVAVVVALVFGLKKDSDINTTKIMTSLAKKITTVTDIINYSEANDPNGIMGQADQYTSKSSWEDSRITEHDSEFAGTIEVFSNTKDAELREWKINNTKEACERNITAEKYGSTIKSGWNCKEYYMFRKNTVVVRLSMSFNNEQIAEYEKVLNSIIDGFVVPEENVPTLERINELRKQDEENLSTIILEQEKKLQEGLDDILLTYSNKLDAILESLNEDELASAKDELEFFKEASYFSSKIADLEQKINNIEDKIANQKKQAEEAAARAETEKLAQKNRRLGSGKYETCVDVDSGTYDVTAVSGGGNLFVHSDKYSRYVNELMHASGSYGWSKEYKNMTLSCGDVLEIKNGLVIQLTAKR